MKLFLLLFLFLAGLTLSQYEVDSSHTSVSFSIKHMVISTVKGSFTKFEGNVVYDENDLSKWKVSGKIYVDSINMWKNIHL